LKQKKNIIIVIEMSKSKRKYKKYQNSSKIEEKEEKSILHKNACPLTFPAE